MPGQVAKLAGQRLKKRRFKALAGGGEQRNERFHSSVSSQDSSDRTRALSIARAHAIPFNVSSTPDEADETSQPISRRAGISRQSNDASRVVIVVV